METQDETSLFRTQPRVQSGVMIRAATEKDFSAIATITNHYIATTAIHFANEPLAAADIQAMWFKGSDRFPWFVADQNGGVGYAKAGTWRLGKALYKELIDELGQRGFRSVIAGITLPNDPSIALHVAFGFESVGTVTT